MKKLFDFRFMFTDAMDTFKNSHSNIPKIG